MGQYVMPLRAHGEPEVDDYVVWSTIVDSAVYRGSRDQVESYLRCEWGTRGTRDLPGAFERANATGSSALGGTGQWGSTLQVMEGGGPGLLPRDRLRAYVEALVGGDEAKAAQVLDPLPEVDDDHV